ITSNPETVSTDFDSSSRLYFEPLDPESVRSVIEAETGRGEALLPAVVAYGGQTPLNLAAPLAAAGIPLLGSDLETIDQAEERTRFSALLDRLGIPQPEGGMAHSIEEALTLAERIGFPVIVRPSFVIGGLAIDFCYSPDDLVRQLAAATVVDPDRPVPFMSKVTGVPMVELAVRISLGETLAELGWPNGLLEPPPFVAVKAPAFSTAKLRGVDPSVGPGMQSTGEVIGISVDPRVALAKALTGASLVPPSRRGIAGGPDDMPLALLSIAERDKAELPRLARALVAAGYRLAATDGTRAVIEAMGLAAQPVAKLGAEPDAAAGEVAILGLIATGDVRPV